MGKYLLPAIGQSVVIVLFDGGEESFTKSAFTSCFVRLVLRDEKLNLFVFRAAREYLLPFLVSHEQ